MALNASNTQIVVDTAELKSKADAVSKKIITLERKIENIKEKLDATVFYWEGDAADAYRQLYPEQAENVEEIFKRLKEHPVDLVNIATNYEAAENIIKEEISALPVDIIL